MDGAGDLLTRLGTALAAFDDEALAALANKGLVRRAHKDLESAAPKVLGPDGERLRLEVGDATVAIDPTPSRSACSCPAGGACRHILAALIHLRDNATATGVVSAEGGERAPIAGEPAPTAAEEMRALGDEVLTKWAGKAMVGRAARALLHGLTVEFEEAGAVVARFPTRNVTCRWMPGGGLAGMVCSCHAPEACEHKVAAVLAMQAASGLRSLEEIEPTAREASADAPRTRAEVLEAVGDVARKLVGLGTTRLSRATGERLRTLAVSAHGVDLPRLERLLRALADEVELGLARAAQADGPALLARTAQVEALAHAIRTRPMPVLIGEHRTAYEAVGDIEIVGLGARRWRARSGYAGLTVYFWDRSARRWASWTEARPLTTGGLDPEARYESEGPWTGLASPAAASRHVLRLSGAYRNRNGRLSGRASTRALPIGASDPHAIPGRVDRWAELVGRARLLFGGGFRDSTEQDELVLLAPAAWGPAEFDPVRQELVRTVLDVEGQPIPLVLRQTPETQDAVDALEAHDPATTHFVLGILRLDAGRLAVEPIALHHPKGVFNLTLDAASRSHTSRPAYSRSATPEVDEDDSESSAEDDAPAPSSTRLGVLLDALASHLETIGEGGLAAFRTVGALRGLADRAEALGLSSCGRSVGIVIEHLERQRRGESIDLDVAARDLLRAYHVLRLAAAQEAVAAATARLAAQPSSAGTSSSEL